MLELREDDEFIQRLKEPVFRLRLSAGDLGALAEALHSGTGRRFGKSEWWKGQTLKVTGRPAAGLTWRNVSVVKWLVPFYWSWTPRTLSGKFIAAIAEAAAMFNRTLGLGSHGSIMAAKTMLPNLAVNRTVAGAADACFGSAGYLTRWGARA